MFIFAEITDGSFVFVHQMKETKAKRGMERMLFKKPQSAQKKRYITKMALKIIECPSIFVDNKIDVIVSEPLPHVITLNNNCNSIETYNENDKFVFCNDTPRIHRSN